MFDIGQVCVKVAGRDAGQRCVIVQKLDDGMVLIDGQTRRRKCNIRHLEPTNDQVELKEGASGADVKKALGKLGIEMRETKPKKAADKPTKQKAKKEAPVKEKPKKAPKIEAKADADEVAKELAGEEAPAKEAPKAEEKPAAPKDDEKKA